VPVIHGWPIHRHPGKKHDPDHLLQNAGGDAERKRARKQRYDICLHDKGPQESPHQPANCAPDEKLHPPHFDQKQHADPVTQRCAFIHSCQREQDPTSTEALMRISGCMKNACSGSCLSADGVTSFARHPPDAVRPGLDAARFLRGRYRGQLAGVDALPGSHDGQYGRACT